MEHRARKRFGQNFLTDPNTICRIVDAIRPRPGDTVVEIGPGLGALTTPLLAALPHLHVVEIDRDLISRLRDRHSPEHLTIHEGDALAFDFARLGERLKVVGNLPYNISTPLLFHLADFAERVEEMTFMLQKEVVMRMVAEPGSGDYGRLSVMLQYRFAMLRLFDVPPGAFRPAPKVTSSIVRMVPKPAESLGASDPDLLGEVVAAAFGQRRKTLRNTLKAFVDAEGLEGLGIDPGLRAERLALDQFVAIANRVVARRSGG
ncbi:MAG: 16S rRNA (adenine(1518)-N(6)/adenine(1519)-N(6))-dimethyltransferase RsmA [Rhodocyclaceae bacterium]|nr:16S rRNA (adenine(1518)-N(6)/adenine(1519)-N(6))-dimethyltransferase RsmA [Rhodocyclaceae bacterium]